MHRPVQGEIEAKYFYEEREHAVTYCVHILLKTGLMTKWVVGPNSASIVMSHC